MTWGERLREALRERGWSAYRLAGEVGAHRSLVGRWLSGETMPRRRYRAAVAAALGEEGLADG